MPSIATALSMDECVALALARSPAARAAAFDVDAAAARLRAARAAYAPRLSARGEYGRSAGFDEAVTNGGSTAALLTVDTTLFDGGLRDAQLAAARARLSSANALQQQRRADVAFATRTAYLAAVAADAEAAIHHHTLGTLRDYTALLERQEQVALVTRNDVLRATLAADSSDAAERAATADRDAAVSELRTLIGADLTPEALVEPPAVHFTPADSAAIEASPLIVDAQASAAAARRDAEAVRSEWRTHLDLTASSGALGVIPDTTFRENGGAQFLFGLSVPLYDGGATAARVAAAAAAAESAQALLQEARQALTAALNRTNIETHHAATDLDRWQRSVPRAAESFVLMRARYFGGGNVRLLEVLDALSQHVDAQLAVARAQLAYRMGVVKQQQLIGEVTP